MNPLCLYSSAICLFKSRGADDFKIDFRFCGSHLASQARHHLTKWVPSLIRSICFQAVNAVRAGRVCVNAPCQPICLSHCWTPWVPSPFHFCSPLRRAYFLGGRLGGRITLPSGIGTTASPPPNRCLLAAIQDPSRQVVE